MIGAARLRRVNLHPGDLHIARQPMILETTLGSCVAASFWSDRIGAGGLCHGVLPRCPPDVYRSADSADRFRYVDAAIRHLAQTFDSLGAHRSQVRVKLFGGGDVLPVLSSRADRATVGAMNCRAALEALEEEGFPLAASDLGGTRGRRIQFHTGTGEVRVYRLEAWSDLHRENSR